MEGQQPLFAVPPCLPSWFDPNIAGTQVSDILKNCCNTNLWLACKTPRGMRYSSIPADYRLPSGPDDDSLYQRRLTRSKGVKTSRGRTSDGYFVLKTDGSTLPSLSNAIGRCEAKKRTVCIFKGCI